MPRVVTASPSDSPRAVSALTDTRLGFESGDRLHTAAEFSAVFSHRRVLRGSLFDLHYCPNRRAGARLGLVIAKKLARQAVLRNLLKRLGREAFRQTRAGLPDFDLVLRLAKPVGKKLDRSTRKALRAEIDVLLARLRERGAT